MPFIERQYTQPFEYQDSYVTFFVINLNFSEQKKGPHRLSEIPMNRSGGWVEQAISRILYPPALSCKKAAGIYLGQRLPVASSDQPESSRASNPRTGRKQSVHPSVRSCSEWGLPSQPVTRLLVSSYLTISPLPGLANRLHPAWANHRFARSGRSRPPCFKRSRAVCFCGRVGTQRGTFLSFSVYPPPNRAGNFHCTRLSSGVRSVNLTILCLHAASPPICLAENLALQKRLANARRPPTWFAPAANPFPAQCTQPGDQEPGACQSPHPPADSAESPPYTAQQRAGAILHCCPLQQSGVRLPAACAVPFTNESEIHRRRSALRSRPWLELRPHLPCLSWSGKGSCPISWAAPSPCTRLSLAQTTMGGLSP